MKILVLSDSHSALRFMQQCIDCVKPDHVIHLGDHYDDGQAMAEKYPHIRFHQVPGNCDRFRCPPGAPEMMCYDIGGVRCFMTHGHHHGVKSGDSRLIAAAEEYGSAVALYGHTHSPVCFQTQSGMWVMNPGTCGSFGGSVGLVEIDGEKNISCRILRQEMLENF